jgi:hypothetical protein
MAEPIKIIGEEFSLSTANTVGLATLVRVHNNSGGVVLITRKAGATTLGSASMPNGSVEHFAKASDETLTANAAVLACSIAYS